jgi:hypothetical protein
MLIIVIIMVITIRTIITVMDWGIGCDVIMVGCGGSAFH